MLNIKNEINEWLVSVVIGLNLCPFAAKPTRENRVRITVSNADTEETLLVDLSEEIERLETTSLSELETTLLVSPYVLQDFYDYTQFLGWAEAHLKRNGWQGVYQLASFHPDYCFTGAEPEDAENLTNRAPYPILHIIREASLSAALAYFPDIDEVPFKNRLRVEALDNKQKEKLFHYLFKRK